MSLSDKNKCARLIKRMFILRPSYCPPQFVETPKPPSPNMSRQRLRGGKSIEVTPISDSSESGRRTPSPAGTRSGLKYGVPAMFRQSHESGQQTRTYTDYLRPQREEENMEDIRQQLHYSQRQDPSLSHLWGKLVIFIAHVF